MEFFRWILILVGVALLVVAYLMGSKKTLTRSSRQAERVVYDPSVDDDLSAPLADPLHSDAGVSETGVSGNSSTHPDHLLQQAGDQSDQSVANTYADHGAEPVYTNSVGNDYEDDVEEVDLSVDEYSNDRDTGNRDAGRITSFASAVTASNALDAAALDNTDTTDSYDRSFNDELEVYPEPVKLDHFDEKLISINVVAASGRRFYGKDLKALFDKHGYKHGRMSLYHCSLDGDKVFSVANMVKPGTFDESQMRVFETPGITLFMRLPVELDSDVAFDFLIQEAKELADELDGQLRDGNRNPLSEQTIQHMREEVQQYMFRSRRLLQPTT